MLLAKLLVDGRVLSIIFVDIIQLLKSIHVLRLENLRELCMRRLLKTQVCENVGELNLTLDVGADDRRAQVKNDVKQRVYLDLQGVVLALSHLPEEGQVLSLGT